MPDIIYLNAGGGVGDFIYTYFRKPQWRLLEPVKKAFPKVKTIACIICHSSAATELIELNPNIDATLTHPWRLPGHEDERLWKHLVRGIDIKEFAKKHGVKAGRNKLYLSKADQNILDKLSGRKYVVLHPFAGLPHRGCLPHPNDGKYRCFPDYSYPELIARLGNEGYDVVLVGRSERGNFKLRQNEEYIRLPPDMFRHQDYIHNYINIASLRASVAITRAANGFIGSHSSMLSAAWTADVPSVFFYPANDEHGNARNVRKHGGETGTWALDKPWNKYFELPSKQLVELEPKKVVDRFLSVVEAKSKV